MDRLLHWQERWAVDWEGRIITFFSPSKQIWKITSTVKHHTQLLYINLNYSRDNSQPLLYPAAAHMKKKKSGNSCLLQALPCSLSWSDKDRCSFLPLDSWQSCWLAAHSALEVQFLRMRVACCAQEQRPSGDPNTTAPSNSDPPGHPLQWQRRKRTCSNRGLSSYRRTGGWQRQYILWWHKQDSAWTCHPA